MWRLVALHFSTLAMNALNFFAFTFFGCNCRPILPFNPYNTPTFKTEELHLVSDEGRMKNLWLLYKSNTALP